MEAKFQFLLYIVIGTFFQSLYELELITWMTK
jgi:hypothetical protein